MLIDLDRDTAFGRIVVKNRYDCCGDRAVPLVLEVSKDSATWTKVAQRDEIFDRWTARFPTQTARFVRARVERASCFHLEDIAVYDK